LGFDQRFDLGVDPGGGALGAGGSAPSSSLPELPGATAASGAWPAVQQQQQPPPQWWRQQQQQQEATPAGGAVGVPPVGEQAEEVLGLAEPLELELGHDRVQVHGGQQAAAPGRQRWQPERRGWLPGLWGHG
jgi:hypothetical protein